MNSVVHHFNIFSLQAWANIAKCYLCQQLLSILDGMYGARLNTTNFENFRTEVCWRQRRKLEEEDRLYFVITNPSCKRGFWNFRHYFALVLWPMPTFAGHFTIPAGLKSSEILPSTGSPTSRALAVSWLSQCRANEDGKHKQCNDRDLNYLPTRLLDVKHAQKTARLRLIHPALDPASFKMRREWMTLSHCWGIWGAQNNPVLSKGNLKKRQNAGISLKKLPKTFRDTLEIADWLGSKSIHSPFKMPLYSDHVLVDWLWIDCLCIIQDSREDWLREATIMSKVYQNAAINVSADSGTDSRAGCFVQRNPAEISPLKISSPQLSQSWEVLPDPHFLFQWMRTTPSFTRAWIHRERQLARRVLHFTDKELIWECCGIEGTAFASEMLPGGAPFKRGLFNSDHKYQIGRLQQGLTKGAEETYATWNDICEHLSGKSLSKPSDMPIVLSGLAKDFANLLPTDKYIVGLWHSTLPHGLLWHTKTFKPKKLEFIAPSWTWLSTGCAVSLANRSDIMAKHSVAEVANISTTAEYGDPYGSMKESVLEMKGIIRHIRIAFKARSSVFDLSVLDDDTSDERVRAIGHSWDKPSGDRCILELDALPRGPVWNCFAVFITIQQWKDTESCRDIACLLLERCNSNGSKFIRIGTLVLHDMYGLKMRYETPKDLDEDVWEEIRQDIISAQDPIIETEKKRRQIEDGDASVTDAGNAVASMNLESRRQPLQGIKALYQFDDDETSRTHGLRKLAPQIVSIV